MKHVTIVFRNFNVRCGATVKLPPQLGKVTSNKKKKEIGVKNDELVFDFWRRRRGLRSEKKIFFPHYINEPNTLIIFGVGRELRLTLTYKNFRRELHCNSTTWCRKKEKKRNWCESIASYLNATTGERQLRGQSRTSIYKNVWKKWKKKIISRIIQLPGPFEYRNIYCKILLYGKYDVSDRRDPYTLFINALV